MAVRDPSIRDPDLDKYIEMNRPVTNQVAPTPGAWQGPVDGSVISDKVYKAVLAAGRHEGLPVGYDYRRQTVEIPDSKYEELLALLRDKEAKIAELERLAGNGKAEAEALRNSRDLLAQRLIEESMLHDADVAGLQDSLCLAVTFRDRARTALELSRQIVLHLFNETSDNELFSRCKRAIAAIDDVFSGAGEPECQSDHPAPLGDQAVRDGRDSPADGPAGAPGGKLDCQGEGTYRAAPGLSFANVIAIGDLQVGDPVTVVEHPCGDRYAFRFDGASEYRVDDVVCKPIYRTLWGKDNINNIWPIADQGHAKIGACEATWGTIRDTYPTPDRWISDLMKGSSEPPLGDARPKVEYHYMGQLGIATLKVEGEVYDAYPEHAPETWVKPAVEVVPLPEALKQKELSAEDLKQLCRLPLRYVTLKGNKGKRLYDYQPQHVQEMKYLGLDVNKEVDRKKYVAIIPAMPDSVADLDNGA